MSNKRRITPQNIMPIIASYAVIVLLLIVAILATSPAHAADFKAQLTWGPVSSLVDGTQVNPADMRYVIERRIGDQPMVGVAGSGEWRPLAADLSVLEYRDTGSAPSGTIVHYRAAAVYKGIQGEWAAGVKEVGPVEPGMIQNLQIELSVTTTTTTTIRMP